MSYEKQTWQTGDVVTSAKLNHMEDGIAAGGGALVVHLTGDTFDTLDKTAAEIWTAMQTGTASIVFNYEGEGMVNPIISAYYYPSESSIVFTVYDYDGGGIINYTATSGDAYPKCDGGQ